MHCPPSRSRRMPPDRKTTLQTSRTLRSAPIQFNRLNAVVKSASHFPGVRREIIGHLTPFNTPLNCFSSPLNEPLHGDARTKLQPFLREENSPKSSTAQE